jgi:hypothetical protein
MGNIIALALANYIPHCKLINYHLISDVILISLIKMNNSHSILPLPICLDFLFTMTNCYIMPPCEASGILAADPLQAL